ncbi:hypothetical protein ALI44B_04310 [Leifsonia sp. ALI-44-B]|uniref:sensor histidine kinase n=1 Tax=Leifsonia sp. ALI-44-B TaxID=1933776 RepID=UPI00097C02FF|nr:ATP-binding protein [Leifsonia sp. ALI-44-B]ONI63859.1 hypothetical protein ALI44B_04310 [Leifsonia sp. ALI-44-B]
MTSLFRRWSISARLFALQLVFVVLVSAVVSVWLWLDARSDAEADAAAHTRAVAASIADNPFVQDALAGASTAAGPAAASSAASAAAASATLQPYAEKLMRDTSTDFITIMAPDRTRYTHPDRGEIGRPFIGTIGPALEGRTFSETYAGTLGPSVRSVAPVYAELPAGPSETGGSDGATVTSPQIVGLVSAGVTVASVADALQSRLPIVLGAAALTIVAGAAASWLLSRYLRRVTRGRGPEEMARMFGYYEGVLHALHEGLLLVDPAKRLVLFNDEAAELLGLPQESRPGADPRDTDAVLLGALDLPAELDDILGSGEVVVDRVVVTRDRVLVVNQEVAWDSTGGSRSTRRPLGTVTTLRDHTDLRRLAGELETARTLTDALRSQTHEHSNRLHTVVSLLELGRTAEAIDFAADQLDRGQALADDLIAGDTNPVLQALLLGKAAQASERGIRLVVEWEEGAGDVAVPPDDLVTIVGNLIDNGMDAAAASVVAAAGSTAAAGTEEFRPEKPWVRIELAADGVLRVSDSGRGRPLVEAGLDTAQIFERGTTSKEDEKGFGRGIGLALVRQAVVRSGGSIAVLQGEDGHRMTFEVRLPLAVSAAQTGRES